MKYFFIISRICFNRACKSRGETMRDFRLPERDFIFHMDRDVRENFLPSDWSHDRDA